MTPSELLSGAADLVRDTAAAAVPAPWESNVCDVWFQGPYEAEMVADCGDARTAAWIALASPAVAPMIEYWLRHSAAVWEASERHARMFEVHRLDTRVGEVERKALELAQSITGESASGFLPGGDT